LKFSFEMRSETRNRISAVPSKLISKTAPLPRTAWMVSKRLKLLTNRYKKRATSATKIARNKTPRFLKLGAEDVDWVGN